MRPWGARTGRLTGVITPGEDVWSNHGDCGGATLDLVVAENLRGTIANIRLRLGCRRQFRCEPPAPPAKAKNAHTMKNPPTPLHVMVTWSLRTTTITASTKKIT